MASELGKAYIQVVPTTKGIKGSLEGIMNKEGGDAGLSAGKLFGGKFIKMLGALGIGKAIYDLFKSSIDEGGALQQSLGGIETLFKDSSDRVIENANNAWKTSGLSANEYMETATSFSASLLQGLGGDTEEAARITDMAIVDMSDNANKFGTDMQSIQNAYMGFAKQNYTMLD